MKTPYDILGVSSSATDAEIKKAFRRLAKKYHPDTAGGSASAKKRFQEISSAYEIVGDKKKRAAFDAGEIDAEGNPRAPGFGGMGGQGFGDHGFGGRGFGGRGFGDGMRAEDIFADMMGDGGVFTGFGFGGRRKPQQGRDIHLTMTVSFREAALGDSRRVTLADGHSIEVKIPRGIKDGQQIRVKGRGGLGQHGGRPGDLMIQIHVQDDASFTRDGNDLRCDVPITLKEAVLGGRVPVETLTGTVSVSVPAGANSGMVLRLRGKGIPAHHSAETGDLYVRLLITLPESPDPALQRFVESWTNDYDPRHSGK